MRISFILSSLGLSGGVLLVVEYANHLVARGHAVAIVVPGATVDPVVSGRLDSRVRLVESGASLPSRRTMLALLKLSASLAWSAPVSDVFVATHTPTVVPAWLARVFKGRGRLVWLYMDYQEMFAGRPVELFLLRRAPRWFECILTISGPLQRRVSQQTRAPVVVIGAGLRRSGLFFEPARPAQPDMSRRVFCLTDDRPRKGLREFIAAAELVSAQMPEVRFVIAAKRPCIIETAIPIEFHLRPSDEELAALYRHSSLFVFPSWGEGLGYPPLEAMACGTPVILSNSQGVLDYARDGENCLLVPPRDPQALAEAMRRLLTDGDLSQKLGQKGRLTAQRYTWEAAVDRFETALIDLGEVKL